MMMKKGVRIIINFIVFVAFLFGLTLPVQAEADLKTDGCAISIAMDISGSMKNTDPERYSIELLKMLVDICGEEDALCITLYNDDIAYCSGMLDLGSESKKTEIKNKIDAIEFRGDTDNGLGMLTATKALTDYDIKYKNSFVILVSDGNTDLPNSPLNRTVTDSDADLDKSCELAIANSISLNTIAYNSEYSKDTGIFSVVTAATGGSSTLIDNPIQFIQVMLSVFMTEYSGHSADIYLVDDSKLISKTAFDAVEKENETIFSMIFSTEPIVDFELLDDKENLPISRDEHYAICKISDSTTEEVTAMYSFSQKSQVVVGTLHIIPEAEEVTVVVNETVKSKPPVGTDKKEELYTSKNAYVVDISPMFTDEEKDIVSYALKGQSDATISGSMLTVDISKASEQNIEIVAKDAGNNYTSAVYSLAIVPSWKKYEALLIGLVVFTIAAAAVVICVILIKKIIFSRSTSERVLSGVLHAQFIDLKSKNESSTITWVLDDYTTDGLTLDDLFHYKKIRENLYDADKIYFLATEFKNEIILTHCMEGGVFVGDCLVKPNVQFRIKPGSIIYLSFAENASEIELRYEKSGS